MAKTFISSRIFVPAKKIDQDQLEKYYEFQNYDEKACGGCRIYKEGFRHSDTCDSCPAYLGIMQMWRDTQIDGIDYIGLPPGRPNMVAKVFDLDLSKAVDLRPELPLDPDIKFILKLRDGSVQDGRVTVNQKQVVADWLKHRGGIIQVPPRGGKTVMSIAAAIELGFRFIIIAKTKTLLRQFYDTILGNSKRGRPPGTNIRELRKQTGKKYVKIINKISDFEPDLDIAIVNYQKFIRNKKSIGYINKLINNKYSLLIVDEVHQGAADAYLKFITRLNCKYRMGLSASPKRKDGKDRMMRYFIGDIVAISNVVAKIPTIELFETGVYVKNPYRLWVYAMKHLANHKERCRMIVREVFKDLRDGHHSIIIPVDFVKHGNTLLKMINQQAEINNQKRKENWPSPIATFFTASVKKSEAKMQKMLNDVDDGKFKVLIAMRSMFGTGVDLANPTMLYNVIPCSANKIAEGSPLFFQLGNRICTWAKDKKQPVIKLFLDGMNMSAACLKSLWWLEIFPRLTKKGDLQPRYLIEPEEKERIMQVTKEKNYIPVNKPGERLTSKEILKINSKSGGGRGFSSF